MKALAIVGSPRVGGNSQVLAETCLDVIAEQGIQTGYHGAEDNSTRQARWNREAVRRRCCLKGRADLPAA